MALYDITQLLYFRHIGAPGKKRAEKSPCLGVLAYLGIADVSPP